MYLILGEKVFTEIITWRHKNNYHFSPKGKSVTKMDNYARGVKSRISYMNNSLAIYPKCTLTLLAHLLNIYLNRSRTFTRNCSYPSPNLKFFLFLFEHTFSWRSIVPALWWLMHESFSMNHRLWSFIFRKMIVYSQFWDRILSAMIVNLTCDQTQNPKIP